MTSAHHLRLIDGMCTRDFPTERIWSGSGVSGPGYHTASLHGDAGQGDDEAARLEHRAQCLAEHEALLMLLTARWGEPQLISLWSAQQRMIAGEEISEPWSEAVARCEVLQLWRIDDRWIAMGFCTEEEGPGCELYVLVTDVDPP